MNNIQKKMASIITASSMLLQLGAPVLATTNITITGNGAGADNYATVTDTNTTVVSQNNSATVYNNVDAGANTGGNSSKFNTGGPIITMTGDATTAVSVTNNLNSNAAHVECCDTGETNVEIKDNGAYSDNIVGLTKSTTTVLNQDNYAFVKNNVDADANTGKNTSSLNTGGDVVTVTGKASTAVAVSTTANRNVAHISSPLGGSNPSASFVISGNGAFTDNFINADLAKVTSLAQKNSAKVYNNVDADANTGWNKSDYNTGGEVATVTGDAVTWAEVANDVNFNYAAIDCGCAWDVMAKIADNGASLGGYGHYKWGNKGYDNVINAALTSAKIYGQDNYSHLDNDLYYLDAHTGKNTNSLNTTGGLDPLISTGHATTGASVNNSGNVNTIGQNPMFDMPWEHANVNFNMSAVLALFGLYLS